MSIKYKIKVAHSLGEVQSPKFKANSSILRVDMEMGRNRKRKHEEHNRKEEEHKRKEEEKR